MVLVDTPNSRAMILAGRDVKVRTSRRQGPTTSRPIEEYGDAAALFIRESRRRTAEIATDIWQNMLSGFNKMRPSTLSSMRDLEELHQANISGESIELATYERIDTPKISLGDVLSNKSKKSWKKRMALSGKKSSKDETKRESFIPVPVLRATIEQQTSRDVSLMSNETNYPEETILYPQKQHSRTYRFTKESLLIPDIKKEELQSLYERIDRRLSFHNTPPISIPTFNVSENKKWQHTLYNDPMDIEELNEKRRRYSKNKSRDSSNDDRPIFSFNEEFYQAPGSVRDSGQSHKLTFSFKNDEENRPSTSPNSGAKTKKARKEKKGSKPSRIPSPRPSTAPSEVKTKRKKEVVSSTPRPSSPCSEESRPSDSSSKKSLKDTISSKFKSLKKSLAKHKKRKISEDDFSYCKDISTISSGVSPTTTYEEIEIEELKLMSYPDLNKSSSNDTDVPLKSCSSTEMSKDLADKVDCMKHLLVHSGVIFENEDLVGFLKKDRSYIMSDVFQMMQKKCMETVLPLKLGDAVTDVSGCVCCADNKRCPREDKNKKALKGVLLYTKKVVDALSKIQPKDSEQTYLEIKLDQPGELCCVCCVKSSEEDADVTKRISSVILEKTSPVSHTGRSTSSKQSKSSKISPRQSLGKVKMSSKPSYIIKSKLTPKISFKHSKISQKGADVTQISETDDVILEPTVKPGESWTQKPKIPPRESKRQSRTKGSPQGSSMVPKVAPRAIPKAYPRNSLKKVSITSIVDDLVKKCYDTPIQAELEITLSNENCKSLLKINVSQSIVEKSLQPEAFTRLEETPKASPRSFRRPVVTPRHSLLEKPKASPRKSITYKEKLSQRGSFRKDAPLLSGEEIKAKLEHIKSALRDSRKLSEKLEQQRKVTVLQQRDEEELKVYDLTSVNSSEPVSLESLSHCHCCLCQEKNNECDRYIKKYKDTGICCRVESLDDSFEVNELKKKIPVDYEKDVEKLVNYIRNRQKKSDALEKINQGDRRIESSVQGSSHGEMYYHAPGSWQPEQKAYKVTSHFNQSHDGERQEPSGLNESFGDKYEGSLELDVSYVTAIKEKQTPTKFHSLLNEESDESNITAELETECYTSAQKENIMDSSRYIKTRENVDEKTIILSNGQSFVDAQKEIPPPKTTIESKQLYETFQKEDERVDDMTYEEAKKEFEIIPHANMDGHYTTAQREQTYIDAEKENHIPSKLNNIQEIVTDSYISEAENTAYVTAQKESLKSEEYSVDTAELEQSYVDAKKELDVRIMKSKGQNVPKENFGETYSKLETFPEKISMKPVVTLSQPNEVIPGVEVEAPKKTFVGVEAYYPVVTNVCQKSDVHYEYQEGHLKKYRREFQREISLTPDARKVNNRKVGHFKDFSKRYLNPIEKYEATVSQQFNMPDLVGLQPVEKHSTIVTDKFTVLTKNVSSKFVGKSKDFELGTTQPFREQERHQKGKPLSRNHVQLEKDNPVWDGGSPVTIADYESMENFDPMEASTPLASEDLEDRHLEILKRWLFQEAIPQFLAECRRLSGNVNDDPAMVEYAKMLNKWLTTINLKEILDTISEHFKGACPTILNAQYKTNLLKAWFQFEGLPILLEKFDKCCFGVDPSSDIRKPILTKDDYKGYLKNWLESSGTRSMFNKQLCRCSSPSDFKSEEVNGPYEDSDTDIRDVGRWNIDR